MAFSNQYEAVSEGLEAKVDALLYRLLHQQTDTAI